MKTNEYKPESHVIHWMWMYTFGSEKIQNNGARIENDKWWKWWFENSVTAYDKYSTIVCNMHSILMRMRFSGF